MKEISEEEFEKLDSLRFFMLNRRIKEIQDILIKYYPIGTKITIDSNHFHVLSKI